MEFRISLEWDEVSGLTLEKMYPFYEGIEELMELKNYGASISTIWIVLTCRRNYFKQRKKYKKDIARFEYDILLDFYPVKDVELEEKKMLYENNLWK